MTVSFPVDLLLWSNKSTGKETCKTHLCVLKQKLSKIYLLRNTLFSVSLISHFTSDRTYYIGLCKWKMNFYKCIYLQVNQGKCCLWIPLWSIVLAMNCGSGTYSLFPLLSFKYEWIETWNVNSHECQRYVPYLAWNMLLYFWCSTCPLVFGCCELSHVIFLKLRKKKTAGKAKQIHKLKTIFIRNSPRLSFWVKLVCTKFFHSQLEKNDVTQLATAKN